MVKNGVHEKGISQLLLIKILYIYFVDNFTPNRIVDW